MGHQWLRAPSGCRTARAASHFDLRSAQGPQPGPTIPGWLKQAAQAQGRDHPLPSLEDQGFAKSLRGGGLSALAKESSGGEQRRKGDDRRAELHWSKYEANGTVLRMASSDVREARENKWWLTLRASDRIWHFITNLCE